MANPLIVAFCPRVWEQLRLTLCMLGDFLLFFVVCWIFVKINFFEKLFQEYHQGVNILDPNQAWQFVNPDLGPNRLQSL